MRNLTADYILNADGILVTGYLLRVRDDGTIVDLAPLKDEASEFYPGILCPGFINAHLHLELSGLLKKIVPGGGLDAFISQLIPIRNSITGTESIIRDSDNLMWENGIQGAGDICNTVLTLETKLKSKIRYHSFIEIFGFDQIKSVDVFNAGLKLLQEYLQSSQHASLVPHAPYSVTPALFKMIADQAGSAESLWTIHNQESAAENSLFFNGTGSLKKLFTKMGVETGWLKSTGNNSLHTTRNYFPEGSHLMLVHNTFITNEDLELLNSLESADRTWFCICANANLFIENRLPDINMLREKPCRLIIGTDSLASNYNLSILEEIKTINHSYPNIPIAELLTWATMNAADYFNWNDFGRFLPGKQPGVISISDSGKEYIGKTGKVTRVI